MFVSSPSPGPTAMCSSLPVLLAIITLATPLAGQAPPGHVYWTGFYQALPGKAAADNIARTSSTDTAAPQAASAVRHAAAIPGSAGQKHTQDTCSDGAGAASGDEPAVMARE